MSELFIGKFKLEKTENFDEFLKELGVNIAKRTLAAGVKPTIEISLANDTYKMKTSSTFKTSEIEFKLGVEFDEMRQDDVKVKSVITADGNKLIHKQKADKDVNIVREFSQDGMTATATIGDVKSVRFYKRQ